MRTAHRRCRISDLRAVAVALGESLVIQMPYQQPRVGDGTLILTKNATDTRWWQALARAASAVCFPTGRLTETTTMQGPSLFYFGHDVAGFVRRCRAFGHCWIIPSTHPHHVGETR